MEEKIIGTEELFLDAESDIFEIAENVAKTYLESPRYSFIIEYDLSDKELFLSVIEKLGAKISKELDFANAVVVSLSKEQLGVVKMLDCVQRVEQDGIYTVIEQIDADLHTELLSYQILEKKKQKNGALKIAILSGGIPTGSDIKIVGKESFCDKLDAQLECGLEIAELIDSALKNTEIEGTLFSAKIISNNGIALLSDIMRAIDWAIEQKMDMIVLNVASEDFSAMLERRIKIAFGLGITVVSVGSIGEGENAIYYPGIYDSVVCAQKIFQPALMKLETEQPMTLNPLAMSSGYDVMATSAYDDCTSNTQGTAILINVGDEISGVIGCPYVVRWYKFVATATCRHTITTKGSLDTVGYIYGSNICDCNYDDDSGDDRNFFLEADLIKGYTYHIKVSAFGRNTGSFVLKVTKNTTYVSSITVNPTSLKLHPGDKSRITATVMPTNATNGQVSWTSSNIAVATVSTTGTVTAIGVGTARVTAKAKDGSGKQASCNVSVIKTNEPQKSKPENKTTESKVADPVDAYSGAHTLKHSLFKLADGQGIEFVAEYNSSRLQNGDLGVGWYHNFEKRIDIESASSGGAIRVYENPSVYCEYAATDISGVYECTSKHKAGYVLIINTSNTTYPYCLNCNSQHREYYDSNGRLVKITSHRGFDTTISYSETLITITDCITGKKIYADKNTAGRIYKVRDQNYRRTAIEYSGEYVWGISDVNWHCTTYSYDSEGRIKSGTDGSGTCYFYNTYDSEGRVISQRDGVNSNLTRFEYNGNTRIITNRNGDRSIRVFDDNGMLIKYVNENGNEKTYTYDDCGNVISEADALGNIIKKEYNEFNWLTSQTDKNGNKTSYTYDTAGNITKIIYPTQNGIAPEESFEYNTSNQLLKHIDLRGTITLYTYGSSGMPLTKKVGNKNAIQYEYSNGRVISETDANGNRTKYTYDSCGRVASKIDARNNTTFYKYENNDLLYKETDANCNSVYHDYDCNRQETSVTDARGYITKYDYNGNLKNTSVTFPDSSIIKYEYDGEDRLVKTIDQLGNITLTQYDKTGKVVAKQFPDGTSIQYEYDVIGNIIKEINQKGAVITRTYDAVGNVTTQTDDNGNITHFFYDSMNRLVKKVSAIAGTTLYDYSPAGDLLCETDALGNKKTYTYDEFGNRLTSTDAMGNTTSYQYDANNNLVSVTDPLNNTTTYTYNANNQLLTVKDAKNRITTYSYDALGRRVTITDARGNSTSTVYDANGNVTGIIDAKGTTMSSSSYDNMNRPTTVYEPSGDRTLYTYNKDGKVATTTDDLDNKKEYSYNCMGQNVAVKNASKSISLASFDDLGNITQLAGPLGGSTNYTYDDLGRLIAETTTSGGEIKYGYNALNVKESVTNARGQKRTYFYDVLGRITGYTCDEGAVSYTYDANGNVLTVTDKNGTITRAYDALNRVVSCTDTFGNTIEYVYDTVGNLERLIYPDGSTVNYAYDENNNLITVTDWASRITTYTYDKNNNVTRIVKPDGSVTTTSYGYKQRIYSTVEETASGSIISGFQYSYDSLGRIDTETHLAKNIIMCYTYDKESRVTKRVITDMCCTTLSEETYSYDAAGNVTVDSSCIYDKNNRLIEYNGKEVVYDLDGNMLSDGMSAYEYDSANRLIEACANEYTYNAEDVRIRNLCGEEDTTYIYNTNCRLSQLLSKTTNGVVTKYVYGLGLIGEETSSNFKTYHFDYRGSTVAITNLSGTITDTFEYDTYGKLIARTGSSDVLFIYNGRDGVVTDRNGLLYMRARYYSPDMRRFINADIISGEISNAITLNRYAYANGNPVSNIDPFGLSAERGGTSESYWVLFKNTDGTYSLYDNKRFDPNSVFHEQILSISPSGPSFDLIEGNIGLGSIGIDGFNGGWEWKYVDLSLLDIGHAEAGAELKNGNFYVGAFASAYSPSFSVKIFGIEIEVGGEIGAVGGKLNVGTGGFSAKAAYGWGLSLNISW